MNRELFDFAVEVYQRAIKFDNALDEMGYCCDDSIADKAFDTILKAMDFEDCLTKEVKTEDGDIRRFERYYIVGINDEKITEDEFVDGLARALNNKDTSLVEFLWYICNRVKTNKEKA